MVCPSYLALRPDCTIDLAIFVVVGFIGEETIMSILLAEAAESFVAALRSRHAPAETVKSHASDLRALCSSCRTSIPFRLPPARLNLHRSMPIPSALSWVPVVRVVKAIRAVGAKASSDPPHAVGAMPPVFAPFVGCAACRSKRRTKACASIPHPSDMCA